MCSYGLDMSSTAKKRANRRNGARSRGPTSAEGKARSAQNRFLYAIDARAFVAVGEDAARFRDMARMVLEAFRPQTRFERLLVHRLCSQLWQRERLLRMERAMLGDGQAAAALPEALRQSAMAGVCVERLPGLLELQIKLDDAIRQSIALLANIGLMPRQQAPTTQQPNGGFEERAGQEMLTPSFGLSLPDLPAPAQAPEEDAPPPRVRTMAAPPMHFGRQRPKPRAG
jgi:hypothetical protein